MPDTLKLVIVLPTLVKRNKERKKKMKEQISVSLGLQMGIKDLCI